ncbi:MAG: PAS domain S-box protein [Gemmatimonadota bacterium]|nr:PAS domain S-box protein [Gemmatimonadota bacterium]
MNTGESPAAGSGFPAISRTDAEHREFARQLAAEKAKLIAAQAVAKVGSWETDLLTFSVTWSDETHRIFGTSPATFAPSHEGFLGLVHPEDRGKVDAAFKASIGRAGTHTVDHRVILPNGGISFVEERWAAFSDEYGTPVRAVGTSHDITERTLSIRALRDSEERFASAFENAPIGVALISLDGRWLMVNKALCEMLGFTRVDLLTRTIQDITHPDDLEQTRKRIRETAVEGQPFHFRIRYMHALGHTITAAVTSTLVHNSNGEPRYFVSQVQDITEREKNEASLRLQARMLDSVGQAIISTDPQGVVTYVNRFAETLYGWPAAEMIGRNIVDTISAQSSRTQAEEIMTALTRGESWKGEIELQDRDGKSFRVAATDTPVHDPDGELVAIVGISDDITKRTEMVNELRASEERFRTLAESVPQIVWVTRPDGGNIYFNQKWMDYTGLTLEESLGDGWNKPFHPDDQQRAWDAWKNATDNIGVYSLECRLRRADGEYRWWLIRGVPRQDADGKILDWFGTCTDIHDIKEEHLEFTRVNRALKLVIAATTAVIQIKTEPELLAEICRIATEVGGYAMAWIGYAVDDEEKSITPVAYSGAEDGYLSESKVTWDANNPTGRGPAGVAIRTGKAVVSDEFAIDPRLEPWRSAANRRGYTGAIALPLRNAKRTYGLIALYCIDSGPPNEEEIDLLEKLADGVAFGINKLRTHG